MTFQSLVECMGRKHNFSITGPELKKRFGVFPSVLESKCLANCILKHYDKWHGTCASKEGQ